MAPSEISPVPYKRYTVLKEDNLDRMIFIFGYILIFPIWLDSELEA
jgi:hypothetical protein